MTRGALQADLVGTTRRTGVTAGRATIAQHSRKRRRRDSQARCRRWVRRPHRKQR